jgi:hypothetical protein
VQSKLIVATEALAEGSLTRRDLRRSYVKVHRNVYARTGVKLTALDRAHAAWLWSGRRATLVGHSASALLGSQWIPDDAPVELVHSRRPAARGITVHSRQMCDDEVCTVGNISCTTPARTAYDLGRRLPLDTGIIRIDALLFATKVSIPQVESIALRYPGARNIRRLRGALDLADGGAESPEETRLRLLLVRSGLPRPVTQIPVTNEWGRVVSGSTWAGRSGSSARNTTAATTGRIPTSTQMTSSGWNSLPRKAGPSCESVPDSCGISARWSSNASGPHSAVDCTVVDAATRVLGATTVLSAGV